jgi:hypothetical protein
MTHGRTLRDDTSPTRQRGSHLIPSLTRRVGVANHEDL